MLAYHKVRNCYAFHGYINEGEREIGIGNGVTARIVNYIKPDVNETWSTLYWEQRVERGGKLFYQRIVMLYALRITPHTGRERDWIALYSQQCAHAGIRCPSPEWPHRAAQSLVRPFSPTRSTRIRHIALLC